MSFVPRKRDATAGFSLTEALVALAIAAFLAAVLTRFMSGTRLNAFKVREEVAMDVLSDSLLERLVARELQPGRTDGRSGSLRWRIDVAPIAYYARARSVAEKKPAPGQQAPPGQTGPSGQSGFGQSSGPSLSNLLGQSALSSQTSPTGLSSGSNSFGAQPAPAKPAVIWSPFHVTAVISSPSGRSHEIDTIRIVQQRPQQQTAQDEQH